MGAREVLLDNRAACSSVWRAVTKLLGPQALAFEPDTLRIELERRGVEWTADLAAKVLGAQTIQVSREWLHSFDVFFAFALAGSGVPSDSEMIHHPTVIDLAWAALEVHELLSEPLTDDLGFDPDRVDPAIAVVLHDDGWVYTPDPLRFAQAALDHLTHDPGHTLRDEVAAKWASLKLAPLTEVRAAYERAEESPLKAQLGLLYDCAMELNARAALRETHRRDTA